MRGTRSLSHSVLDQAGSISSTADGQTVLLFGLRTLQAYSSLTEPKKTIGSFAQEMCTDGKSKKATDYFVGANGDNGYVFCDHLWQVVIMQVSNPAKHYMLIM